MAAGSGGGCGASRGAADGGSVPTGMVEASPGGIGGRVAGEAWASVFINTRAVVFAAIADGNGGMLFDDDFKCYWAE